jgi:hypothetical protein
MNQFTLARYVQSFLQPLSCAVANRHEEARLIARLGYVAPPTISFLGGLAATIKVATDAAELLAENNGSDPDATGRLVGIIIDAVPAVSNTVTNLRTSLPSDAAGASLVTDTDFIETLPRKLFDLLFIDFLDREAPGTLGILHVLSIVRLKPTPVTGDPNRVSHVSAYVAWELLPTLASNPLSELKTYYGWGTPKGIKVPRLFESLRILAIAAGLRAEYRSIDPTARQLIDQVVGAADRVQQGDHPVLLRLPVFPVPEAEIGVDIYPIERAPGIVSALAFDVFADANAAITIQATDTVRFEAHLSSHASGLGVVVRPNQPVTLMTSVSSATPGLILNNTALDADLVITFESSKGMPLVLLGTDSTTRLQVASITAKLVCQKEPVSPDLDLRFEASMKKVALIIRTDHGDGFLAKVLPKDGVSLEFDFLIGFSLKSGIYFGAGGAAEVSLPMNLTLLDLFTVKAAYLALKAETKSGKTQVAFEASTHIDLAIGPVKVELKRLGVRAQLQSAEPSGNLGPMDFGIGFKPPSGLGITVEPGPVKGGGFIAFEPEVGQYSGALQLSVKAIDIAAIGLVNTRLPDNPNGYSFLVILAAQFPSIPLSFGFALQGVGGIVGIHRRMDTEALKRRVSEGALASILFPRNPVGRIEAVLADLRSIFPIQEGRFVFGPMVKLSWGPSALLRMELAVVLDLPSPLRLAILGRMRLLLPTEQEAIADIRLEVAGILDFDRQEATVTATLIDSRLAGFTLTGDMAMVLGWGATKAFCLSMGGFFPGYPVPERMPTNMKRLTLALSSGDNPRLRFESYFAVTSNSVQFGAAVEVYAAAVDALGTFEIRGRGAFDALIEFEPFRLLCQLRAEVSVSHNRVPILMARLQAQLSGPRPWHAVGFAEFKVVVASVRIPFEITVGTAEPEVVQEVDLRDLLEKELTRKESWSGIQPDGAGSIAVLKDTAPGNSLVLHPLSSVTLMQRLMPFEKTIRRYGGARPAGGPVLFRLTELQAGNVAVPTPEPVLADFAPGQFDELTEDEKLSRPAFEALPAGGRAALSGFLGSDRAYPISMDYIEHELDLGRVELDPRYVPVLPSTQRAEDGLRTDGGGIRVAGEQYVLADSHTLELVGSGRPTTAAQTHDAWQQLNTRNRMRSIVALACEVVP